MGRVRSGLVRGHDAGGLIHGCSSLDSDTGDDPAGLLNILRRSPSAQVFAWCRNVVFGDPWAMTELRPELPLLPVPAAIQAARLPRLGPDILTRLIAVAGAVLKYRSSRSNSVRRLGPLPDATAARHYGTVSPRHHEPNRSIAPAISGDCPSQNLSRAEASPAAGGLYVTQTMPV